MLTPVIIPAFRPDTGLLGLARQLVDSGEVELVIVDDGSGEEFAPLFRQLAELPRTEVLAHAVNLGKGAALKTALNRVACRPSPPPSVVTADADGQHLAADILAVARRSREAPELLILGARRLPASAPFRSRLGNRATRILMRGLAGLRLTDTQTGLRAVPLSLVPVLLPLRSNRYEFELDMLILCKRLGVTIEELPISPVYLDGNRSSHFHPLLDSMRIYLVLFRYTLASLASALIDFAVFSLVFASGGVILTSQVVARGVSLFFNYAAVRAAVFHDRSPHRVTFPRYLALVFASGLASYSLILLFADVARLPVLLAKPVAETLVYFANFTIQRDYIFRARSEDASA